MSKGKKQKKKKDVVITATIGTARRSETATSPVHQPSEPPAPQRPAGRDSTNATPSADGTLQQQRARFALNRVTALTGELNKEDQKRFNSYASAMPFMIHANGLGQTSAFYRRKGTGDIYYRLYQLLGDWLSQPGQPFQGRADLLEGITQSGMATYRAAQVESMLFLNWVKQFANAFMASE